MGTYETVTDLGEIQAPWNKQLTLQELVYEGGFAMLRVRIKERRRFTDLELDPGTARRLAEILAVWADQVEGGNLEEGCGG